MKYTAWIVSVLLLGVTAGGCATSSSYYGIDIASRHASPSSDAAKLQELARRARAGDKRAQLNLGIRLEEGLGVTRDIVAAKALYSEAAKDTQLKQTAFVPDGGSVRAETTYVGVRPGLEGAKDRLATVSLGVLSPEGVQSTKTENVVQGRRGLLRDGRKAFVGAGSRAVQQLAKIEYFSDLCLNGILEDEVMSDLGVTDELVISTPNGPVVRRLEGEERRVYLAQRCLDSQKMPTDCKLLQEELIKITLMAYTDPRFSFLARSMQGYGRCVSSAWVDEYWRTQSRNKSATPLDHELYSIGLRDHFLWRRMRDPYAVKPGWHIFSAPRAATYWEVRCRVSSFGPDVQEIDLVMCDDTSANSFRRHPSVKKLLIDWGVEYER